MNKKHYFTDAFVVYHRTEGENGNLPCFFRTKNWKDKCTFSVEGALKLYSVLDAEKTANALNIEAKHLNHCLAGHIKFGRLCVEEIDPTSL